MSFRERHDILSLAETGRSGIFVTLVHADGPSYRRPGARLLALQNGRVAGSISGGCLEADLLRKAAWHLRNGAAVVRYDTAFEDDAEMPFGLGCGGAIDLLLEDAEGAEARAVLEALAATHPASGGADQTKNNTGELRIIVTQLPAHPLGFARIVLDKTGDVLFATESLSTDRIVDLRAAARSGVGDTAHLCIETLTPTQRLIVCGAGEDAKPVVRLAAEMGWSVHVVDGRADRARPDRFPQAHSVHHGSTLAQLNLTTDDAVVVMTHSFEQDSRLIAELLRLPAEHRPRYIGLLGARSRSALLLRNAAEVANISFEDAVAAVQAPVGLNLGGDGPESVALSIVAGVQHRIHAQDHRTAALQQSLTLHAANEALARLGRRTETAFQCALDSVFVADDVPTAIDAPEIVATPATEQEVHA